MDYRGVVLDAEFTDPGIIDRFDIFARRRDTVNGWTCFGIRVAEAELDSTIDLIQLNLREGAPFYAHLYNSEGVIVIFKGAVFRLGADPGTWASARAYGRNVHHIPESQLDFFPHTPEQEARCFTFL